MEISGFRFMQKMLKIPIDIGIYITPVDRFLLIIYH